MEQEWRYEELRIRYARPDDVMDLKRWWNDGKVMDHAGFPDGLGISEEKILSLLAKDDEYCRHLILEYREEKIGEMNYTLFEDHAEIGIKICEADKQEKGLGRLYLSLLIEKLFEKTDTITLDTCAENKRARHVYELLGFRMKKIHEKGYTDPAGRIHDVADYELNKEDFHSFLEDYYLVRPEESDADMITDYRNQMLETGSTFDGCSSLQGKEDPLKWIGENRLMEMGDMLPPGYVPSVQYALYDRKKEEIAGLVNIRPDMNGSPFLEEYGGNIGYSIKPSRRGEGLAELQLKKALDLFKRDYHLDRVLVTCLESNEASRRTIKACGGVYERTAHLSFLEEGIERYIIFL